MSSFPRDVDEITLNFCSADLCNAEKGSKGNKFFSSLADSISGNEGESLLVGLKSFTFNNSFYNISSTMRIPVKLRYQATSLSSSQLAAWTEIFYYEPVAGYYDVPSFVDDYTLSTIRGSSYLLADLSTQQTAATLAEGGNKYIVSIQPQWKEALTFPNDDQDTNHEETNEDATQHRFFETITFSERTGKITFQRPAYALYYQVDSGSSNTYSMIQKQMELLINAESETLLKRLGFYRQDSEIVLNEEGEKCIILAVPYSVATSGNNQTVTYNPWNYTAPYMADMGGVNWIDVVMPDCSAQNYSGDVGAQKPTTLAKTALLQRVAVIASFGEDQAYQPQNGDITYLPFGSCVTQIRVELTSTEQELDFQGINWYLQLVLRRSTNNTQINDYHPDFERRTLPITQQGLSLQDPLDTHKDHVLTGLQQMMYQPNQAGAMRQHAHQQHQLEVMHAAKRTRL